MKSLISVFSPLKENASEEALMRLRCDSQSMNYYGDLSRYISKNILGFETLSLLDVGPRTGSGLALLRLLHHPTAFTRLKLDPVYGIDLDPEFQRIAESEFEDIYPMTGDIFDLNAKSYDVVTCSHTIEHIPDLDPFIEQMANIARRAVVIACPFEEVNRVPGHVNTITQELFDKHDFIDVEVYDSNHWHNGVCCLAFRKIG
ncbi:class I SAM-dependent methyltransferase [Rhizobium lusitanum]|uniref:2-polyprenyl-3-methyl-5-hydroxy-6-metoxy-1, 4-benzoquinol methylase n=1 Tax=Rhizobium lusitanum TaxID=293958 RepID=A0A7X0IVY8_9HYPH|nr:methyltransferase domain-containing protein [Rhizobium lusitanum]MBB6486706.1 2-polyprenyl-3-methyl-5-hydroxy-6-metoxy-1,4-benzoquinol methylase [Rhizobium lusitanum]